MIELIFGILERAGEITGSSIENEQAISDAKLGLVTMIEQSNVLDESERTRDSIVRIARDYLDRWGKGRIVNPDAIPDVIDSLCDMFLYSDDDSPFE